MILSYHGNKNSKLTLILEAVSMNWIFLSGNECLLRIHGCFKTYKIQQTITRNAQSNARQHANGMGLLGLKIGMTNDFDCTSLTYDVRIKRLRLLDWLKDWLKKWRLTSSLDSLAICWIDWMIHRSIEWLTDWITWAAVILLTGSMCNIFLTKSWNGIGQKHHKQQTIKSHLVISISDDMKQLINNGCKFNSHGIEMHRKYNKIMKNKENQRHLLPEEK